MSNEIVKVEASDYGIEKSKVNELMGNLPQIVKERSVLEKQFDQVIKLDIKNNETAKQAHDLRLLIQKNRTKGVNVWHKTSKDYFLKGGQFIDAIKRREIAVNERMENDLLEIEKYQERKEEERIQKIREERFLELTKYERTAGGIDVGLMDDDIWSLYLSGVKTSYDLRKKAEKEAEAERIENERLDKLEKDRAIELAPYRDFNKSEDDIRNMPEQDYQIKLSSIKEVKKEYDLAQEKVRIENERLKKEAKKKEKEQQAEIEKGRKEREAIQAELDRKKKEEVDAEIEKQIKIEADLKKGDAAKVKDLIKDLEELKVKYSFKSKKNKIMLTELRGRIDVVIDFVKR